MLSVGSGRREETEIFDKPPSPRGTERAGDDRQEDETRRPTRKARPIVASAITANRLTAQPWDASKAAKLATQEREGRLGRLRHGLDHSGERARNRVRVGLTLQ